MGDDAGRYFKIVTTVEVTTQVSQTGEQERLRRTEYEAEKIGRQFSHHEWFTGPWRGRMNRIAAIDISELEADADQG